MSGKQAERNGKAGYQALKTRAGWVGLAFDQEGLLRVLLPQRRKSDVRERLADELGSLEERPVPRRLAVLKRVLEAYFEGRRVDPAAARVPLSLRDVTPFRRKVWSALREVPRGTTVTYRALATMAGSPGAARGVGTAMAGNRFPLVVPCHRVIGSDGRLHGFSAEGGVATKRELLALEGWEGQPG